MESSTPFNTDNFSKPMKTRALPVAPHVVRDTPQQNIRRNNTKVKLKKSSTKKDPAKDKVEDGKASTKTFDVAEEFKSAARRFKLKLEPYDPDAKDGDGDGIVQEGTAWERPAGARIVDRLGKEIERGLVSGRVIPGAKIVDRAGRDVEYRPTWSAQRASSPLGKPVGEIAGTVARQVSKPSDKAVDVDDLRPNVEPAQRYKTGFGGRIRPDRAAIDIRAIPRDPYKSYESDGLVGWEESEDGTKFYDAIDEAGRRFWNALEQEVYGGPVPQSVRDARLKFYEDRRKIREDRKNRIDQLRNGWVNAERKLLEELRDLAVTTEAKNALDQAISKAAENYKKAIRKDPWLRYDEWEAFSKDVMRYVIDALEADEALTRLTKEEIAALPDDDIRKVFEQEDNFGLWKEDLSGALASRVMELFGSEMRGAYRSRVSKVEAPPSLTLFKHTFGEGLSNSLQADIRLSTIKKVMHDAVKKDGIANPEWLDVVSISYPNELSNDRIPEVDYLHDRKKNLEAFLRLLTQMRDDIGTESLLDIFNEFSIESYGKISRADIKAGLKELSAIMPGRWLRQFMEAFPKKLDWQWTRRGHYDNGKIAVSGPDWKSTLIHEFGHGFEQTVAGLLEAERLFYNRRYEQLYGADKKKPKPRKVTSSQGNAQKGFPLKLDAEYTDVYYSDEQYFELLTMSLEALYRGQLDIPEEQLRFVLGVLALL